LGEKGKLRLRSESVLDLPDLWVSSLVEGDVGTSGLVRLSLLLASVNDSFFIVFYYRGYLGIWVFKRFPGVFQGICKDFEWLKRIGLLSEFSLGLKSFVFNGNL